MAGSITPGRGGGSRAMTVLARFKEEVGYWREPMWRFAEIEAHFDELAATYDAINERARSYFRRFTDTMRLAQLPDDAYVLDVCARTGNGMAYFYEQGKVAKAVCADVSQEMGKRCAARLGAVGFSNYRWVQIRNYKWPFGDGEFDVTLSLESAEHFARPDRFIMELGRVTRAGGVVILSTPNVLWEPVHALAAIAGLHHSEGPHRFIPYKQLRSYLTRAGLQIEYAETSVLIPAGPSWLTGFGERLERWLGERLMSRIGLRRLLICRKLP